jgi:hypothetical protein
MLYFFQAGVVCRCKRIQKRSRRDVIDRKVGVSKLPMDAAQQQRQFISPLHEHP